MEEETKMNQNLQEDKPVEISQPLEEKISKKKERLVESSKDNLKAAASLISSSQKYLTYIILAVIVFIAVRIRTLNLSGLRDVTNGSWTLGPDSDPFLFLRWAKYIVEHGSLYAIDTTRYAPLGIETSSELLLLPYSMAWFHKLASLFGSTSVEQSSAIYPAFMFALTVIAFFFFTRKIFSQSLNKNQVNIIALIASLFLSIIPVLLPRTIAGIPEKESAAFLFLFLGFYFFLSAWHAKSLKSQLSLALLAGLSTAAMALTWGGFAFLFLTLGATMFINFILGQLDKKKLYLYLTWIISTLLIMFPASSRYEFPGIFKSIIFLIPITVLSASLVHFLIYKTNLKKYFHGIRISKSPPRAISLIIAAILGIILVSIFLGQSFITDRINGVIRVLVNPITDRLGITVAENRQPFFTEWAHNFGPILKGQPVLFWLGFIGSIYLFYHLVFMLRKKERIILSISYALLLSSMVFGRISPESILNGASSLSFLVYSLGILIFAGTFSFFYYKYYRRRELSAFKKIDYGLILLFSFFFVSIVAARGAIRLIMVLVPPISIIVSYFAVMSYYKAKKIKDILRRYLSYIIVIVIIFLTLFSGYNLYNSINAQAEGYVPSLYTQQWQKAMSWVRENTPQDAVFASWWDYGYWTQSIGERATVLDGGNVISYWNHLIGRYALTGTDNIEALEFLYAHNSTHFLIDSTDIGKYSAFSLIGSDTNYDRASSIFTLPRNNEASLARENSTISVYQGGGIGLEENILYKSGETEITLPQGQAAIIGVITEKDSLGKLVSQPRGVFLYQEQQYTIPIRYAFDREFIDFGVGIESGIFIYPRFDLNAQQLEPEGALLYLSRRTVKSQFARLYLYKENNPYFKLVHSEDEAFVSQIRAQYPALNSDFIDFNGLRGPIRIWEINYPENIEFKEEYLETEYPKELQITK